ncbi:MAG: hypothetical protein LBD15_00970 [Holosporales bacterium]|jgi:opacity protein-like surface antigen|nr:hypothetical protein [Holosporales bacterium]
MRRSLKIYTAIAFGSMLLAQIAEAVSLSKSNIFPKEGWYIGSSVGVTGGRWTKDHPKERQFSSDSMGMGFSFMSGYIRLLKSGFVLGGEARCDFFANTKERCDTRLEQCAPAFAIIVGYSSTEMHGTMGITLGGAFIRSKIGSGPHHGKGPHMGPPPGRPHRGPRPGPHRPHMRPPHGGPQGPHAHEERDINQMAPELGVFYTTRVGENMFLRTDVRYAFGLKKALDFHGRNTKIQTSRMMAGISIVYHF